MKKPLFSVLSVLPSEPFARPEAAYARLRTTAVTALCYDSRRATEGTVFFCLVGKTVDGHKFAPAAYAGGCRVFVTERTVALPPDAVQLVVPDTRAALADCAAAFYDHPEDEVRLVGLTGTKGKTTTAILIRELLCAADIPTGYIGTNGVDFGSYHYATVNSTPESVEIYRYLRMMADEGIRACVLEVSSQALWMERVRGLHFDTTLFTNLSRDHIGGVEHPDFEHYRASKRRLFTDYPTQAIVVNEDDSATAFMLEDVPIDKDTPRLITFSTSDASNTTAAPADAHARWEATDLCPTRRNGRIGVSFVCTRDRIRQGERWFLPLPGDFNVQNALAALAVACERFGVSVESAQKTLEAVTVSGRFETVTHPALPEVTFIIDYAHNGVSLSSILDALAAYAPTRLICLFGSVGGRTVERRRDLALAAAHRCDLCILTSDNPASEPPMDILLDIDAAFPSDACPRIMEPDRAAAIRMAVDMAMPGDLFLLAGKGHEDYQLIGTHRVPFSEHEILLEAIRHRAEVGVL